ncbi:MBL fold metallo-hydrolase [Bacillus spongiae]|uniref:MBL fold metallo-hydrolase n=1 Tax=Bacillus spongiae TaxID=2683610 RepID=A0ABU8HAI7_9BACI
MKELEIKELTIPVEFNGKIDYIHPTLIIQDKELTLVDTGYAGFLPLIEQEIIRLGHDVKNLNNIIITHYDDDHIGSLFDFKMNYPSVNIISSEVEAKFISGKVKSERLIQAEQLIQTMPESEREFGKQFIKQLKNIKHLPVNKTVKDHDMIMDNQCQIISTPGHTSGHISLFFPNINCVITGDAAVNHQDTLIVANPQFCLNMDDATNSLDKLKKLQASVYYCYHGGKFIS